ncbi:hypothetical protein QE612_06645 [Streptococcus suis]|uniref:hypothetical protein n=1 Tax=Streptococcus suis TaxID=1307 RepID=UPI0014796AA6|nr:hypothetical protein [Streptococcus suis]MCB2853037.1 hypothetical protein [Streptococcus suis]MCB2858805.1 hypothetical protein [Streptococcus suis]MCB2865258.1 hypothetical protein [Streptococcus suis]MCB2867263.1 hypothetical protein [Streptococcus suis]MCB2871391.1 hypothetical protein [Streptococcus suis]
MKEINLSKLHDTFPIYSTDIIYLSGSLIDGEINKYSTGMGNKKSDLDLFVVRDSDLFKNTSCIYEQTFRKTDFISLDSWEVDIEVYDKNFIEKLKKHISLIRLNANLRVDNIMKLSNEISEATITSFFNRLYNSICIQNEKDYQDLITQLDIESWINLKKVSIVNNIENIYSDIIGNIDEENYEVALLCARQAFMLLVQYIVFSIGDFIDREKWIPIKIKNIVKYHAEYSDLIKVYNLLFFSDLNDNKMKKNISEYTIRYIQGKIEEESMRELL